MNDLGRMCVMVDSLGTISLLHMMGTKGRKWGRFDKISGFSQLLRTEPLMVIGRMVHLLSTNFRLRKNTDQLYFVYLFITNFKTLFIINK